MNVSSHFSVLASRFVFTFRSPRRARWLILLVALSAIPVSASRQLVERMVYASVLDPSGGAVTKVVASDLIVRENHIDRDVLSVSRAIEPFDIAVLVDTSQDAEPFIPDFRQALREFFRTIADRHEIALIGFGQRPTLLVDYTRDIERLEAGIARIVAHTGSGAYLMDSIIETSRRLRNRERSRRQVVVITSEGRELSDRKSEDVSGQAQASGIILEAFVVVGGKPAVRSAFEARTPERSAPRAIPDEPAQERAIALSEVVKVTGGRREDLLTSTTLGAKLRDLAGRLNNQYRVTYEGSPGLTAPDSFEIVTTRPGLRVQVTGIPQNR